MTPPKQTKKKKPSKFQSSISGKYKYVIDDTIRYLKDQGWSNVAISGVLGNMAQESEFNPAAIGPGGFSGTVQMSSDMAKEIKRVYGKVDYKTTNQFIHDAMSGNSKISKPWLNYMKQNGGYYGRVFNSASDAAMAFGNVFERPNEKYANWKSRTESAEHALQYLNNLYPENDRIKLGFTPAKQFEPKSITVKKQVNTQYPIDNNTPTSISSWSSQDSPAYKTRVPGVQEINAKNQKKMWDLFDEAAVAYGKKKSNILPSLDQLMSYGKEQYIKDITGAPSIYDNAQNNPTINKFLIPTVYANKGKDLPKYDDGNDSYLTTSQKILPEVIVKPDFDTFQLKRKMQSMIPDQTLRHQFYKYIVNSYTNWIPDNDKLESAYNFWLQSGKPSVYTRGSQFDNDTKLEKNRAYYQAYRSAGIREIKKPGGIKRFFMSIFSPNKLKQLDRDPGQVKMFDSNGVMFLGGGDDFIDELSHAYQFYSDYANQLGYRPGYTKRSLEGDNDIVDETGRNGYIRPGNTEYDAHRIIQPRLKQAIFNGEKQLDLDPRQEIIERNKQYNNTPDKYYDIKFNRGKDLPKYAPGKDDEQVERGGVIYNVHPSALTEKEMLNVEIPNTNVRSTPGMLRARDIRNENARIMAERFLAQHPYGPNAHPVEQGLMLTHPEFDILSLIWGLGGLSNLSGSTATRSVNPSYGKEIQSVLTDLTSARESAAARRALANRFNPDALSGSSIAEDIAKYYGKNYDKYPITVKQSIENSVYPRMREMRPWLTDDQFKGAFNYAADGKYTVYPEETFIAANGPESRITASYFPNTDHIAVRAGRITNDLGHEIKHKLDAAIPTVEQEEKLLSSAYNKIQEIERGTTNYEARQRLLGPVADRNLSIAEQNKLIDAASDEQIFEAVAKSNGYGYDYMEEMREAGALTTELASAIRAAMKKVGVVTPAIGGGSALYNQMQESGILPKHKSGKDLKRNTRNKPRNK